MPNLEYNGVMKISLLIFALSLPFVARLYASEVDSFNQRYEPLENSREAINKKFNKYFQQALDEANQARDLCSKEELYDALRDKFRNHVFDEFTKWLTNTEQLDMIRTRVEDSIYKDFNIFQSIIQGGYARVFKDPTGRILNFNGHRIGTDKFEHMLGSGFSYFEIHYLEQRPIEDALSKGWKAETGFMGSLMTGVMSYADMAANFQGMRFWNHVLNQGADILGEDLGPYVSCRDYNWVQIKEVDLGAYINNSLDEGTNCSRFRTPKMLADVLNRIKEYEENDPFGRSYSCPINENKEKALKQLYTPELLPWLINSQGHGHTKRDDLVKPDKRS